MKGFWFAWGRLAAIAAALAMTPAMVSASVSAVAAASTTAVAVAAASASTAASASASPATVVAGSRIAAVTVYADRAVVTRRGQVELAAGQHDVVFESLPAALLADSLQVSAQGTVAATILDVSVRDSFLAVTRDERIKNLQDRLDALGKERRVLEDREAVLASQRQLIELAQQGAAAPAGQGTRLGPDQIREMLALNQEWLGNFYAEQRQLDEQKDGLGRQIDALEAELSPLQEQQGRRFKTVTLRLELPRAGKLDLGLAYTVGGASWRPAYDARVRSAQGRVQLSYFGVVSQRTGEDWNQVRLTLSTAQPSLGGSAPPIEPWIVDVRAPRPPRPVAMAAPAPGRSLERASKQESAYADEAQIEVQIEAQPQEVQLQGGATSASFQIAMPATLVSGNETQKVSIAALDLPAALHYQATPGRRETAFLSGEAVNQSEYPLLGGSLNAFLDDTFIAASAFKTVMPGEKLELALGADEGLAVQRKQVRRFTESTGFSGAGRRVTYEYLITLQNHKKTEARIAWRDQVPVSRNEQIVVKLLLPAEKEVVREQDGQLLWNWTLAPGEKREARLQFSIDYPGDLEVAGLD